MSAEDGVEKIIGRFGKYQLWIFILLQFGRFPTEFQLTNVVFILPNVNYVCLDEEAQNATNYCPCANPEYDRTSIENSVTSEWNLICERRSLASLGQSMLQIGILAGSLTYGHISDRFGRRIACFLALVSNAVFVILSSVVPQYWLFLVFRFLIGSAVGGTMLCLYVHQIEYTGRSFRPYLVGLIETTYVFGYFILPIIAYFVRDWRYLQLVTSVPWLIVIVYYWLLPESPRWLITVGRKKEAIELLTSIAKKNGRSTENIEEIVDQIEKELMHENQQKRGSYLDLFKTPRMRIYTVIAALIWFSVAITNFGVNQYIGTLQGNLYLNVMISAATLAPGIAMVVLSSLYLRRKISIISTFSIAGISLLIITFISNDMSSLILAFAVIAQLGTFTTFVMIYLYTSEIFPTVIRNSAMGLSSMFARFGGFIAPFVVNIQIEWVTTTIFCLVIFLAIVVCLYLPETRGMVLLNSVEQAERVHSTNTSRVEKLNK